MLQWQIARKVADYKALQTKDNESLYFIEETGEIYRGEVPFTQACEFYSASKARPAVGGLGKLYICLLYTSPSPRDKRQSRMPSSA